MHLGQLERWLWYLNIGAAVVLLARLYAQQLAPLYPSLSAYLLADTLQQALELAFERNRMLYAQIYFAGQALKVALAIWVVLELYKLALAGQPALARFGRRTLGYLFFAAAAISAMGLFPDVGVSDNRYPILLIFLRSERSVDLVTLVVLILMSGFLLWFPVRVRRNVAFCLGGFVLYSFQRWTGLLLISLLGPQSARLLSPWMLAASLACLLGWTLTLRREGESRIMVTGHRWNSAEAERLTVQLDAINSRLVRLVRT